MSSFEPFDFSEDFKWNGLDHLLSAVPKTQADDSRISVWQRFDLDKIEDIKLFDIEDDSRFSFYVPKMSPPKGLFVVDSSIAKCEASPALPIRTRKSIQNQAEKENLSNAPPLPSQSPPSKQPTKPKATQKQKNLTTTTTTTTEISKKPKSTRLPVPDVTTSLTALPSQTSKLPTVISSKKTFGKSAVGSSCIGLNSSGSLKKTTATTKKTEPAAKSTGKVAVTATSKKATTTIATPPPSAVAATSNGKSAYVQRLEDRIQFLEDQVAQLQREQQQIQDKYESRFEHLEALFSTLRTKEEDSTQCEEKHVERQECQMEVEESCVEREDLSNCEEPSV